MSHVRLQPLKGLFCYKERPLHRAVMTPEPNGSSGWIENAALIWEIEHGHRSRRLQSVLDIQNFWKMPSGFICRSPSLDIAGKRGYRH